MWTFLDPTKRFLVRLGPMLKGAVGAVLVLVAWLVITWVSLRWQEFQIMRADIAYIHPQLEQARQADAAKRATPPAPVPPKAP